MTTTIHSNGSKWVGDLPDSIETLLSVLGKYVLDRRFENPQYGHSFISISAIGDKWAVPGTVRFHGNFFELSHVFSVDTDEPALIAKLTDAIEANMARADYQSQPSYAARLAADENYRRANDAKRQEERIRQAKAVLGIEG